MTRAEIRRILAEAGIDAAAHEADLLIAHYTGLSRAAILADPLRDYADPMLDEAVRLRATRYPLQYIFGTCEFCGLELRVTEDCLIPRPDTEVIAEAAWEALPDGGRLLDLCTGSGCIAAAVLSQTTDTRAEVVDLYPNTLSLALANLIALGFGDRVTGRCGDALTDLYAEHVRFDVIVSNPPYVTADEMMALEPELSHEPRAALTDGGDGELFLETIVRLYKHHLAPGGAMILEHGWRQGDAMRRMAEENGMTYTPIRDYGGNVRGARLGETQAFEKA